MTANGEEGADSPQPPRRPAAIYSLIVGLAFIAIVLIAGVNALSTDDSGLITPKDDGLPLPQFAVPDARSELTGDANIAQDDCEVSVIPCPESDRRDPACEIHVKGAIRVCDLFDRPLVLSFWFTRGGECEVAQDGFEAAYRRFRRRVNFLAVNVRDDRDEVRKLIAERGWTHPVGLDSDGALSNLYRIGACPTFLYVYPGGILQNVSIGDESDVDRDATALLTATRKREEAVQ
jgi:hypothetical protein